MPLASRLLAALMLLAALAAGGCRTRDYVGEREAPQEPGIDYVVQRDDTLSRIAATYGITVDRIVAANRLGRSQLRQGQVLRLPGARAPLPPPLPVAVKAVERSTWFIPRSQWANEPIMTTRVTPMGRKPYRITVHHSSAVALPGGIRENGDAIQVLRFIEDSHKRGIGKNEPFACIGYHFVIAADGRIYEGRPLAYQGAHATGDNNIGNIGVCLLGDFDHDPVPRIQRDRLIELLDRLCAEHGIVASAKTVLCHKDFKSTDCPGRFLEPTVRAYARGRGR
jgi:LysM repeat protein